MTALDQRPTLRECAIAVIDAIRKSGDNSAKLRSGLLEATKKLAKRSDLFTLGAKRQGNHISNSKYLYYDGELAMTLDELPKGKEIPPHDHGVWEALVVVKGRLHHGVYERIDDRKVEGHSELKTIEDRDYTPGEIAMVVPPTDIHSFKALEDDTYVITIVGGDYAPLRHYYNLERQSYAVATPGVVKPKILGAA